MTISNNSYSKREITQKSSLGLAFLGDAVYELLVRNYILEHCNDHPSRLHARAVSYVCATAQCAALEKIMPLLSETEQSVVKRARNSSKMSLPKNTQPRYYRAATGLEALFGYLYFAGDNERITELFDEIIEMPQSEEE